MTIEEKAKEIVQGVIHDRGCSDVVTDRAIYNSAITMAEWKDEQFAKEKQALIDKACEWLIDNIQNYTDNGMGEHSFVLVQDLKEDFKQAMKGEEDNE